MPENSPQTTQQDQQRDRSEQSQPELNPGVIQQQIEAGNTAPTRHYWQVPGTSQPPIQEQKHERAEEWTRERERDDFSFSM